MLLGTGCLLSWISLIRDLDIMSRNCNVWLLLFIFWKKFKFYHFKSTRGFILCSHNVRHFFKIGLRLHGYKIPLSSLVLFCQANTRISTLLFKAAYYNLDLFDYLFQIMVLTLQKALYPRIISFLGCVAMLYIGFLLCGWLVLGPYISKVIWSNYIGEFQYRVTR